jgi:hypothetical protein
MNNPKLAKPNQKDHQLISLISSFMFFIVHNIAILIMLVCPFNFTAQ